jgi:hypothetical protein
MNTHRVRLLCFTVVLLSAFAYASGAPGVRIVRLSLAEGDVQIDRNSGDGWEQAINNMPVIGGARIYAAENSKAELELEDGSSIRLAGPAQITLTELSSAPDGAPVNVIQVDSGEVYINARMHHHDQFRIVAPTGEAFAITQPSHLRFTVDQQTASLAVMDGEAVVQGSASNPKVRSGETYNYILGQPESAARLNSVPQEPEDTWDQQRNSYNDQNAAAGARYSGSDDSNAYGVADLGAYGSYSDQPGYGEVWQPYGVGPDWDPYDNGAWSYYPGWGWTFVSAYPWGWAPFFYGDWCYIGGHGWWWRPGRWHGPGLGPGLGPGFGFHPRPRFINHPSGNWAAPHPPAHAAHGTVAVAGSHLSVGPISQTHAPGAAHGAAHGAATGVATGAAANVAGVGAVHGFVSSTGVAASPAARGPASSLAHGTVVSRINGMTITGQKGSYTVRGVGNDRISGTGAGRNGYEVHRPPTGPGTPRTYSYAGSSAPRTYSVPAAPIQHAPPASFAPHVSGGGAVHSGGAAPSSGGFSGGGGFHGGGGFSGGGFHGGGGHR